ncbi:conserved hypothetical protein [Segniliparus rotundus DSM 44985]|uniref:Interferon-induced transmembrane protein n=1 Tax=Segniliparus rotundus (strain ATCC BAA-972 / CDC 1076 / CIP 108378 / DSM 44985 / JCM 13578) TaxID=640132 RepID=D6Z8N3_SEGRD|nr:CD225/dispanin family protein [Segniliparus rotundus]ADG98313.1 conserved hypothetical protein [Segniliparus rotundus DSM 44985]
MTDPSDPCQQPGHGQYPQYGQQPGYGHQPAYGQYPQYGQYPVPGQIVRIPDKHIGWVVAAFLLFLPTGIFALLESNKVDECWRRGDVAAAQRASENTKKIGQWTLYVSLAFYALSCVIACVVPLLFGVSLCGLGAVGAGSAGS